MDLTLGREDAAREAELRARRWPLALVVGDLQDAVVERGVPVPGREKRNPPRLGHGSQVAVELVDGEHLDLAGAFLLGAGLDPAGAHLLDCSLNLKDRLDQPVGVGLLGGRRPHRGVPGGDLRGGDLGQETLGERWKDGQSEQLRVQRHRATSNPAAGNNVFRLSLIDTWAIEAMLEAARKRGFSRLALFAPNTAWGRSSEAAMLAWERKHGGMVHTTYWHNWGETDLGERIGQARAAGAQALVMVANEAEGAPIVRRMAELPAAERLPILSHWGILGGDFAAATGKALQEVDLSVVHTFSFADPRSPRPRDVASRSRLAFGQEVGELHGQVGFAHAYDLTHLLARAIRKAGSLDRAALRSALERLDAYDGLLRRYARPFTPERHEALDRKAVRLGRYGVDGMLRSIDSGTR